MAEVMPKQRFESATTFDQYVERMQTNQERMRQFTDEVQISSEDIAWWRNRGPLKVYTLTFDGCGDALYNIPVMAKIAKQCSNIDLRVVQRDENLDIMDKYLNQGVYRSVPTFIFMNEQMEEIGNLKERPDEMSRIVEAEMLSIRRRLREENKEAWRPIVARVLKEAASGSPAGAVMPRERFASATTFDQYVERMTVNQERMRQFTDEVQIGDEDVQWWRSRGQLNVYTLTYDGCGDALYNIPVMAKIAKQCPNIDLRVVQRDENLDVMDRYLNQGIYRSVPTFIFMNENMQELGNLKERPDEITRIIEAEMVARRRQLREENKEAWRVIVARVLKETAAGQP